MSRGAVREITVLGEFKPFGLTVEAEDGGETSGENFQYFLFDPQEVKQRDADAEIDDASALAGEDSDHEIFVRGNRIIWSAGLRVCKRFTLPSKVTKVCWCRMGNPSEAVLCVLLTDSMTIYGIAGEVVSIALLPHAITAIWPLPFGLLLQREAEGSLLTNVSLSSSNFLTSPDVFRQTRDVPYNLQHDCTPPHIFDFGRRNDGTLTSSHLILRDPLEDPQITFIAERGKSNVMCEFDERTIWTSECVPLMVTYNKAKRQHSLWLVETNDSDLEETITTLPRLVAPGMPKKHLFRRIWPGKGSQTAATKVFLANDIDDTPVVCFLLQDKKQLLSLRLESLEANNEIVYDVKPDMSWSISAITAAAVSVTRPKGKVGRLPLRDVIVLTPENTFLLYSGNLCLCKFVMPPTLGQELLSRTKLSRTNNSIHDMRITDLVDAVEGRVNIVLKCGQSYRCTLQRGPSSSLTNDCISSIAEGINSDFYCHFLSLLWGDNDSTYFAKSNSTADSEWESFCHVIRKLCRKPGTVSETLPNSALHQSWEFLVRSKYNQRYFSHNYYIAGAFPGLSSERQGLDASLSPVPETVINDESFHGELLSEILDSLHAVYETLKVDNLRKRDLGLLVVLLCDIAEFLQEVSYLDHYKRDFPQLVKDIGMPHGLYTPRTPPNLLRWLESCLQCGYDSASISDLPLLICKDGTSVVNWARKIVSFYSLLCGAEQSRGRLTSGVSCKITPGLYRTREELTVLAMVGEKFGPQHLDLLPAGISLPLRHAVDKCRESPPTNWPVAAYVLVGREDLAVLHLRDPTGFVDLDFTKSSLISTTPYMLALHPVTITSSVSDTLDLEDFKIDDVDNFEGPVTDGMEHIFNSNTQLRFGRDLRLNEVRWLLCSARPVSIHTSSNPTASDQDFQQNQLWHLAQRTTALPFGRGAFTLGTICTLLTEALSVPKLVLAGRLPAQQNAMVNLDPNIRNIQELKCWPEFHNAVAAGLRISPFQGKMSKMWILYNKPDEPNATHAGLLLALGLHGHLHVLLISDIFQYYSQDHESTTVGLMIGLAASYRGTMQPSISKSLYVHLPARHPSSFPELELPTVIQSAALISLGLLYEGSAHPQTMQFLLSEIGRRSGGDNVLEREGYAVSAGFSLGLVSLGRGEDSIGSIDTMVERLFQYIGGKELHNDSLHAFSSHAGELNRTPGQIMDGNLINIDVTAPGAVIALALMYLKTESELIVSRLSIPQTQFELQYVRPDFILIRVVARNLIKWSRVSPSEEWIESQIPEVIIHGVKNLGDEMGGIGEMDAEAFVQAYVNIVTGACISLGLRFAGTRDGNAQDLLYKYATYFLNEIKPVCASNGKVWPRGLSSYVDRGTLETCLHLIVLSLCVVMSGSGNLQTFKLLKFLRNRNSADGQAYFGTQMAVSLGIGFLFLGGGMRSFSTSNSSIAALLITLYPRLPNGPNDNRCHLQALRHLYVLATEARWIQTVDVDTGLPVYTPLEVTIRETELYAETSFFEVTPCILPERAILKALCVCGPRYWPQAIELTPEDKPWWNSGNKHHPFNSGILYVKRKVGACSYADDPIGSQSLLSRAMHKMSGLKKSRSFTPTTECTGEVSVEQLVSTFSSDPSLVAFAQLFCDSSQGSRSELDIQMFCLQILFECVRKDRPAMLQVYLSLYTTIENMTTSVLNGSCFTDDLLSFSSLKIVLAYKEALSNGILTDSGGEIVQSAFLGLLQKRVEELLSCCLELKGDVYAYTTSGEWPSSTTCGKNSTTILSWYLQWYNVPTPLEMKTALEKIQHSNMRSSIPLLRLVFPRTHITVIRAISRFCSSSESGEDSCQPGVGGIATLEFAALKTV